MSNGETRIDKKRPNTRRPSKRRRMMETASRTCPDRPPDVSLVDPLREHNASLKIENERLAGQLAEARAQASRAIAAFEALAQRLEAMAAERAIKPWWRRLLVAG
jgi:hypothetical protein